jgi:hypothetical protein
LLRDNIPAILHDLPTQCDFIDLGPGASDKSLIILRDLITTNRDIAYYPVDVSSYFLRMAERAVLPFNIKTIPLHCRFEVLPLILDSKLIRTRRRIIFLGFTFNNFELSNIVSMLTALTRVGDYCLICVQPSTGLNEDLLLAPYSGAKIEAFAFAPLSQLGFSESWFSYRAVLSDNCIMTTFVLKQPVLHRGVSFAKGKIFVTAKSYRLPLKSVHKEISQFLSIVAQYQDPNTHVTLMHLTGRR